MGHTLAQWRDRIEDLVRDAGNKDVSTAQIDAVGILPALGQYTVDRPRLEVKESNGAGSAYFDLPTGWVAGFSRVEAVEYPARENPPVFLDGLSWMIVRKPSDVTTEQILLDRSPATGEYVRFTFSAPWPSPDGTSSTDKVDDVAFNAVTALGAALVCVHLAAEAARDRIGVLPADFADARDRSKVLLDASRMYRAIYDAFLGRATAETGGSPGPVSRTFDYDPARASIFHGGRR